MSNGFNSSSILGGSGIYHGLSRYLRVVSAGALLKKCCSKCCCCCRRRKLKPDRYELTAVSQLLADIAALTAIALLSLTVVLRC